MCTVGPPFGAGPSDGAGWEVVLAGKQLHQHVSRPEGQFQFPVELGNDGTPSALEQGLPCGLPVCGALQQGGVTAGGRGNAGLNRGVLLPPDPDRTGSHSSCVGPSLRFHPESLFADSPG